MNKNPHNSTGKYRFPKKKYNEDIRRFITRNITSLKEGSRILDAGCDTGYLSAQFIHRYNVIGIDKNPSSIESCRRAYLGGRYELCDLFHLSFKDDFFDAIILNMVIEHISELDCLLTELKRVLKKDGIILITTPNYGNLLWVIIENIWFRLFERDFKPYSKEIHPNKFNISSLRESLLRYFKILDLKGITGGLTLTAVVSK